MDAAPLTLAIAKSNSDVNIPTKSSVSIIPKTAFLPNSPFSSTLSTNLVQLYSLLCLMFYAKTFINTIEFLILASKASPLYQDLTPMYGHKFFYRPVVSPFDFWWKSAAWKFPSFQMILYTFTALSLPFTRHIGASTVLRVDLYIGTRLSCTHFGNLNFRLREGYMGLWHLKLG